MPAAIPFQASLARYCWFRYFYLVQTYLKVRHVIELLPVTATGTKGEKLMICVQRESPTIQCPGNL